MHRARRPPRTTTLASAARPSSTVGATVAPSRLPPARTLAPRATASSTHCSTRSAASALTSGPTCGLLVGGVAGEQGLDGRDQLRHEVVVHRPPRRSPAAPRCSTARPGSWRTARSAEAAQSRSGSRRSTTAAALPPSSSVTCLRGDGVHDRLADRAGAGERDDRQPRVLDQRGRRARWAPAARRTCPRAGRSRPAARPAAARTAACAGRA